MHPDPLSSANRRRPGDVGGQLIAGVQLLGLAGVWLATLPIIPFYAGGV